jgi:hypothetical protein
VEHFVLLTAGSWKNGNGSEDEIMNKTQFKGNLCQSCAMPMQKPEDFGINVDGSKNKEYCFHCFRNGKFLDEGITLQEKINKNVGFAVRMGWSEQEARKMASTILPGLKRWKK